MKGIVLKSWSEFYDQVLYKDDINERTYRIFRSMFMAGFVSCYQLLTYKIVDLSEEGENFLDSIEEELSQLSKNNE